MSKEVAQVPVVGFSFNLSLTDRPGGDNAVVQYHLPIDYSLEAMIEHTSKVLEVFAHEKLKYKYKELQREKQISETFIVRAKEDLKAKHGNLSEVEKEALDNHVSNGRKGPIKYTGATGSQRDRIKQDIVSARQALDTAELRHKHLLIELELTENKLGITSSAVSS